MSSVIVTEAEVDAFSELYRGNDARDVRELGSTGEPLYDLAHRLWHPTSPVAVAYALSYLAQQIEAAQEPNETDELDEFGRVVRRHDRLKAQPQDDWDEQLAARNARGQLLESMLDQLTSAETELQIPEQPQD